MPTKIPIKIPIETPTLFEAVGGAIVFERIVENFYDGLSQDPILRPLYPVELSESKKMMSLFLMQYFGGPTTYSEQRGHPRLRMRHLPFSIGQAERDGWIKHMKAAIEAENLPPEISSAMMDYFERTATFMMNR